MTEKNLSNEYIALELTKGLLMGKPELFPNKAEELVSLTIDLYEYLVKRLTNPQKYKENIIPFPLK